MFLIVTTTIDEMALADEVARGAVEERLAACAQISGPIQSIYWWQGGVERAEEWRITFKTTESAAPVLVKYIREHHPFATPEVIATVVDERASNPAYLRWVSESLAA